jgi:membrane protease YdiL (CAAX protease family)
MDVSVLRTAKQPDHRSRMSLILSGILLLWLAYTTLQTLYVVGWINEIWNGILGIIPGILGVGVLIIGGFRMQECYLQWRPVSTKGAAALLLSLILLLPVFIAGRWRGWSPIAALIVAPASAIAQELFFRATLLPFLLALFHGRLWSSLIIHSTMFGLWHIGPVFLGAPVWASLAVIAVPFLGGLAWGWQVQRDQTLVWAVIAHTMILIAASCVVMN